MTKVSILYPMIAMLWWTVLILLLIPWRRIRAIKANELAPDDFSLGESDNVSAYIALANRNYMNLLEAPVIFYVACLVMYLTENVTQNVLVLAWLYVGLRAMHSIVHVTYNNVLHRLLFFASSNLVLMILLISLTVSVL